MVNTFVSNQALNCRSVQRSDRSSVFSSNVRSLHSPDVVVVKSATGDEGLQMVRRLNAPVDYFDVIVGAEKGLSVLSPSVDVDMALEDESASYVVEMKLSRASHHSASQFAHEMVHEVVHKAVATYHSLPSPSSRQLVGTRSAIADMAQDPQLRTALDALGEVQNEARTEGDVVPSASTMAKARRALWAIHPVTRGSYDIYSLPDGEVVIELDAPHGTSFVFICEVDGGAHCLLGINKEVVDKEYTEADFDEIPDDFIRTAMDRLGR